MISIVKEVTTLKNYPSLEIHSNIIFKQNLFSIIKTKIPENIIEQNLNLSIQFYPELLTFNITSINEYGLSDSLQEVSPIVQIILPFKLVNHNTNKFKYYKTILLELPKIEKLNTIIKRGLKKIFLLKLITLFHLIFHVREKKGSEIFSSSLIVSKFQRIHIELNSTRIPIIYLERSGVRINFFIFLYLLGYEMRTISKLSRYGNTYIFKQLILLSTFELFNLRKKNQIYKLLNCISLLVKSTNNLEFFCISYLETLNLTKSNLFLKYCFTINLNEIIFPKKYIYILDILFDLKLKNYPLYKRDNLSTKKLITLHNLVLDSFESSLKQFNFNITNLKSNNIDKLNLIDKIINPTFSVKLISKLNEQFTITPLISYFNSINSLHEYNQSYRIIKLFSKTISSSDSSLDIRDIHYSYMGYLSLIDTSEGKSCGLTSTITISSKFDYASNLIKPIYLKNSLFPFYISSKSCNYYLLSLDNSVIRKKSNFNKSLFLFSKKGNFEIKAAILSHPRILIEDLFSLSENLIPFFNFTEPTRLLMGAKMQTQSLPLLYKEKALIFTGLESMVPKKLNHLLISYTEGIVIYVSTYKIIIRDILNRNIIYYLDNQFNLQFSSFQYRKPLVWVGERISTGQILAENSDYSDNQLSLGKNLCVSYGSYFGYEFEDALILNRELLAKNLFTTVSFSIINTKISNKFCLSKQIPKKNSLIKKNLDSYGIIKEGCWVGEGDIIIGKLDISQVMLSKESSLNKFLKLIFGNNLKKLNDTSITVPIGKSGRIIKIETFLNYFKSDKNIKQSNLLISIYLAHYKTLNIGDKLCGKHGNKGIITYLAESSDLPYTKQGIVPDLITGALGVPSRLNIGQLFEVITGYNCIIHDKRILINKSNLHLKNYDTIKLLIYNQSFNSSIYNSEFWEFNPYSPGKLEMRNFRTGSLFSTPTCIGYASYSKLFHLVKDKIYSRSIGDYAEITQQPIKGRTKGGGQKFGEMEVWALQAYGSAYTLRELLGCKSDDIIGRLNLQKYIVQNKSLTNELNLPESFKLILRELQGLSINCNTLIISNDPKYILSNSNSIFLKNYKLNI